MKKGAVVAAAVAYRFQWVQMNSLELYIDVCMHTRDMQPSDNGGNLGVRTILIMLNRC